MLNLKKRKYEHFCGESLLTTANIYDFFTVKRGPDKEITVMTEQEIKNFFYEVIKTEQGKKEIVKVRRETTNCCPIAFESDDKGIKYRPVVYHFDKTNKNLVTKRYLKRIGSLEPPICLTDYENLKKLSQEEKEKELRELYLREWF